MEPWLPASRSPVVLGPISGYVFLAERVDLLCFVPAELVDFNAEGEAVVDRIGYVAGGWSQRNARWALAPNGGMHVFPDEERLVLDGRAPGFEQQVSRWRQFAAGSAAPVR